MMMENLQGDILRKILHHFLFEQSVDLFASRLNDQLPYYVVYHPDTGASHENAFLWKISMRFLHL